MIIDQQRNKSFENYVLEQQYSKQMKIQEEKE